MAVIVDRGARAMMEEGEDAFYYLTAMNENYAQPSMPEGAEAGILKGMYRLSGPEARAGARPPPRLGRDPAGGDRGGRPAARRTGASPPRCSA